MSLHGKLLFFITSDLAPHQSGLVAVKLSVQCALSVQCWSQWWVLLTEHQLPRRAACRISVWKPYQNWKIHHRSDCIDGRILNYATAHTEPWGRGSQGTGWQEPTTGVTQCGHIPGAAASPQLCVSCGLGFCAASPRGTAQDITIPFSPLVFGKSK